jgi:hypothetical protein
MKFYYLQVNGWNWRTLSKVMLVRLRRLHALPHVQTVDLKKCRVLLYMGPTKRRLHTGRIGQGKKTKNLNVVDVLKVQE